MKRVPPELTVALLTLSEALGVGCRPHLLRAQPAGLRSSSAATRPAGSCLAAARRTSRAACRDGRRTWPNLPAGPKCSSPTWAARGRQIDLRPPQVRGHPARRAGHGRCGAQPRRKRSGPRPRLPPRGRPAAARSLRLHERPRGGRPAAGRAAADRGGGRAQRGDPRRAQSEVCRGRAAHRSAPRGGFAGLAASGRALPAVIVLAYVPEEELQPLAEGLPEVDVVVGGPTGQPVAPGISVPRSCFRPPSKASFWRGWIAPPDAKQHWTGGIVELSDRFADDPAQVANVAQFRQELGRRDIAAADTSFGPRLPPASPKEFAVAGTKTCRDCHKPEAQAWDKSRHARAWKSLEEHGAQVDPDCQRCHTTGYGLPGGFVSIGRSPALVEVGCENCHGPSREHVREPKIHTGYFAQAGKSMHRLPRSREQPEVRLRCLLGQDPAWQGPQERGEAAMKLASA